MLRTRHDPGRILAAVAVGGALGAFVRYVATDRFPEHAGRFPWVTFWINVSGALLLGFVLTLVVERFPPSRYLRPFLATGFCGAYTTFSTLAVEADLLVRDGNASSAVGYLAASVAAGLAAVTVGILAGRLLPVVEGRARQPGPGSGGRL